jgi:hypothetical protein
MHTTPTRGNIVSLHGSIDSHIPVLACEAAMAVDDLIRGRSADLAPLENLAIRLEPIAKVQEATLFLPSPDAISIVMVHHAFDATPMLGNTLVTLEDLTDKAQYVHKLLQSVISGDIVEPDDLAKIKAFCIALSKSASAYVQSLNEVQISQPLWM